MFLSISSAYKKSGLGRIWCLSLFFWEDAFVILFVHEFSFVSICNDAFIFNCTCLNCFMKTKNLQMVLILHFILERSSSVLGILIIWNGSSCESGQINQLQTSLILTKRSNTSSHFLISLIFKSVLGLIHLLNLF